jgi:hypothetical protein
MLNMPYTKTPSEFLLNKYKNSKPYFINVAINTQCQVSSKIYQKSTTKMLANITFYHSYGK